MKEVEIVAKKILVSLSGKKMDKQRKLKKKKKSEMVAKSKNFFFKTVGLIFRKIFNFFEENIGSLMKNL